jgi:hypothetical protein
MKPAKQSEKPPFELIEEAFHLVRLAPSSALAQYYLGSLPFVLGLLFFWSDMARSAYAEQRLIPGVLGLTGLFVWMKAWQSSYCRQLLAQLCGEAIPGWSVRSFLQTAIYQAAVQPAGLFLLPFTLLAMIPFGWTYGFFSSATVIHGIGSPDLRTALARTWRQTVSLAAAESLSDHAVLPVRPFCFRQPVHRPARHSFSFKIVARHRIRLHPQPLGGHERHAARRPNCFDLSLPRSRREGVLRPSLLFTANRCARPRICARSFAPFARPRPAKSWPPAALILLAATLASAAPTPPSPNQPAPPPSNRNSSTPPSNAPSKSGNIAGASRGTRAKSRTGIPIRSWHAWDARLRRA